MEIKPCPICGSKMKITLFGAIDYLTTHLQCSNSKCGADYEAYKYKIDFYEYEDIDIKINNDMSIEIQYISNQIIKSINEWNKCKESDKTHCNICGYTMGPLEKDDESIYCSNTECGFRKKNPNFK